VGRVLVHEIQQSFAVRFEYPVVFGRGFLRSDDSTLAELLSRAGTGPHRILPVVDAEVLAHHPSLPEDLQAYQASHRDTVEFVAEPLVVRGGEQCKNDLLDVERVHGQVETHGLCRHSFVLVIGGGAVLDAVGHAAATAHRGLRVIRMPTTVLAQNDAGIGVKNGVNWHGRKNFLGSFAPPFAVVNDLDFLETLDARDRRAGLAEAVKVALIRDADFFDLLCEHSNALSCFAPEVSEQVIRRCAELHLRHIATGGDPFELGSARPLDFGHWAAHKLEELSENALRHGEAVAIGIAIDAVYSQLAGLIGDDQLHRVLVLLRELGFDLAHESLARLDVERALADFREHLGGELCITLLAGIGRGVEVNEIDAAVMQKAIDFLLARSESLDECGS
jgi:3-dehydroquinate synthase